jgi:hypothetical protein
VSFLSSLPGWLVACVGAWVRACVRACVPVCIFILFPCRLYERLPKELAASSVVNVEKTYIFSEHRKGDKRRRWRAGPTKHFMDQDITQKR